MSPSDPLPRSEVAAVPGWKVQVVDSLRGEQARELVQPNRAPFLAQESEYLLVKVHIQPINSACPLEFAVVGSQRIRREPLSVTIRGQRHDPVALEKENGEAEGWVAFAVAQKEEDLLFVASGAARHASYHAYIALEEGASVAPPVQHKPAAPTEIGRHRAQPAHLGETATAQAWQATLVDARTGREALQTLRDLGLKSVFAPVHSKEYVVVRMRVQYLGTEEGPVRNPGLYLVGDSPIVYTPLDRYSPFYLNCSGFYPRGQYEDWVAFEIPTDLRDLIVEIEFRSSANTHDTRCFALESLGD